MASPSWTRSASISTLNPWASNVAPVLPRSPAAMGIAPIGNSARAVTSFRILFILRVNGSRCLPRPWSATPATRSAKRSCGGRSLLMMKIRLAFSFAVSFRASAYERPNERGAGRLPGVLVCHAAGPRTLWAICPRCFGLAAVTRRDAPASRKFRPTSHVSPDAHSTQHWQMKGIQQH